MVTRGDSWLPKHPPHVQAVVVEAIRAVEVDLRFYIGGVDRLAAAVACATGALAHPNF